MNTITDIEIFIRNIKLYKLVNISFPNILEKELFTYLDNTYSNIKIFDIRKQWLSYGISKDDIMFHIIIDSSSDNYNIAYIDTKYINRLNDIFKNNESISKLILKIYMIEILNLNISSVEKANITNKTITI